MILCGNKNESTDRISRSLLFVKLWYSIFEIQFLQENATINYLRKNNIAIYWDFLLSQINCTLEKYCYSNSVVTVYSLKLWLIEQKNQHELQ